MLQIDKIIYAGNALSIDTIDQQSIVSRVVRSKDGKLSMVRIIDLIARLSDPVDSGTEKPASKTPVADTADTAEQANPLQVTIKQIKATGDSKIHFIDESVDPEFDIVLDFQKFEVMNIDTAKPEQPTTLSLEAKSGKYTTLTADGMIKPFLETLDIDMKAELKAMDLPSLTPYTHDSLGLDIKSGTLETDMRVKTEKQSMDGNVVLRLYQFEVESVDVENSLQSQIPLPLNAALDALRDRNNMIKLEIPIKGDPNSPDFNFNDAIQQALAKGVSMGALAYLSYALQPYGALISIAKYAGEEISRVRLKPAEFAPGESTLDKTDRDYLGKVAKILHDRPKVAVKLCGVAVDKDLDVFRKQQTGKKKPAKEQKGTSSKTAPTASSEPTAEEKKYLEELATKRATVVKEYLVEKHNSDASHLVGCQPKLELGSAEEQPRTDLLI
jgi:outer membrane protein OmpA-like peptidoglycan-associated protein